MCETRSFSTRGKGYHCGNKKKRNNGAEAQNRTADTRLFRPLLYQLSYLGISGQLKQDDKITDCRVDCQVIFAGRTA